VAVSDSAFHESIPEYARIYAIPTDLRKRYGIERQGYHGLSLSSVINKLKNELGKIPEKMIICHLGGGSSVTAVHNGLSVDTSMGWTPLEGVPMAERVGSIDPGALAFIVNKMNLTSTKLEEFLSTKCGLEAISEIDKGDIRDLLELEKGIDEVAQKAKLALDVYTYSIKKEIGKMSAILNGCDMLVFTGTIGLRSAQIRERVVKDLSFIDLEIDLKKNIEVYEPKEIKFLDSDLNKQKIAVVPIDEMREIYIASI